MPDGRITFDVGLSQQRLDKDTRDILRKVRALDRAFGSLNPKGITKLDREMKRANLNTAKLERSVRSASSSVANLGRQAQLTAKRFIVYNIIARFFFTLAAAVTEGTKSFISFDAELNKARQILNPLTTDFNEFTKAIFELSLAYGVTVKEVQAAQEVFIRQGKTQQQVTELTKQSLALASAAGVEFAQATEAITASLNQFTGQGLEAVDVADKFTAVSIRNAVTAEDLAQAIFRAGSAAATVGVEFDNLIGFITAAQEATRRGGRVIGTGLRTIFTRIFRAPSIAAMQELGIETRKTSGEFKDADQLITALADRFTTLSQTQKIAIASTIAGQRQVATLLALLNNFGKAQDATNDSLNAGGEAARLVRIRQEALEVSLRKIITQFQKFGIVIGQAVSGPIIEDIRLMADGFSFLGGVIGSTEGFISNITKSVGQLLPLLLFQVAGLGKASGAFKSYSKSVASSKAEVAAFAKTRQGQAQQGGLVKRTVSRVAGVTKDFQAQAALFKLQKDSGKVLGANRKVVESTNKLRAFSNTLAEIGVRTAERETAASRANENILKSSNAIHGLREKLLKTELTLKNKINTVIDDKSNLNILKEEGRQIRQNIKDRKKSLLNISGVRQPGGIPKGAKSAAALDNTRIQNVTKLLRLEDRIAKLKITAANTQGRTELQNARTRELLEKNITNKKIISSKLSQNSTEKELNIVRGIARERLKLAIVARKRSVAISTLAKSEQAAVAAQETSAGIQQEILRLQTLIEGSTQAIAIIKLETEATELRRKSIAGVMSKLEREQLTLVESKLALEEKVAKQKIRQESLDKRAKNSLLSRGTGRSGATALVATIGLNAAAQGIRDLGKEGDRTTSALAGAFETTGQIALTAMLLPLGPLSLMIIGAQTMLGVWKFIKNITVDWKDELERANKKIDNVTNQLRAVKTIFGELSNLATKIKLEGVSVVALKSVNEQITQMRETFKDISKVDLSRIETQLRKAAIAGDVGKIEELSEELTQLAAAQGVKNLISPEAVRDLLDAREDAKSLQDRLVKVEKGLIRASKVTLGSKLKSAVEDVQDLNEASKDIGDKLSSGFNKASIASQTFLGNLARLGLFDTAKAVAAVARLNEEFLQAKKGFDTTTNASVALKDAVKENDVVFVKINDRLSSSVPLLKSLTNALQSTEETAGKNSTAFFNLSDAVDTQSVAFKEFAAIVSSETLKDAGIENLKATTATLIETFKAGGPAIRAFIDANGELAFKIQGIPGVIGPASEAYGFLSKSIDENGRFIALTENQLTKFTAKQLSNARVTQLLAVKYRTMASSIERTANVLGKARGDMQETISLNSKLAASFPERALASNLEQSKALLTRAKELSQGLSLPVDALKDLDAALNTTANQMSTRIVDAFFKGGDAAVDYQERLKSANDIIDNVGQNYRKLAERMNSTDFEGGLFDGFRQDISLISQELVAIELLSGAALGLEAIQDKFSKQKGGSVLPEDKNEIIKFQAILKKGFDFKDVDLRGTKEEVGNELGAILEFLSSTFKKKGTDVFSRAGQALSQVLVEKMNTTLSTGGDTLAQRLDTVLTATVNKVSDKLAPAIDAVKEALSKMAEEGSSSFSSLVDNANSQINILGDIISRGIIPPDKTLTDILVGQFTVAQEASKIVIDDIQTRIDQLKNDRKVLVTLGADIARDEKDADERARKQKNQRDALAALDDDLFAKEQRKTKEIAKQNGLSAGLNQVMVKSIKQVETAFKNVFSAQNSVATAEEKVFRTRLSFISQEDATLGRRLEILRLERDTFEDIRRRVTGVRDSDIGAIGDEIVRLTKESISTSLKDTASAEFIKTRIAQLRQQLTVENQIASVRVTNLQKELDLLKKQEKQISDLGLTFVKATDEQQKGIVGAARLTDKFFGGIGAGGQGPDTNQVKNSILSFLENSSDQTRTSVIEQLERLKAAGGEVAPGVPAAKILTDMGKIVGDALFKSPAIAIAERQEKLQEEIVRNQNQALEISRVQLRVNDDIRKGQLRLAPTVATLIGTKGISGPETINQTGLAAAGASKISREVEAVIASQRARASALVQEKAATDAAAVSNKRFVDATRNADLSIAEVGSSFEELKAKGVELRSALVEADDAFIDAQQGIRDASQGVASALANAAKAQADYNIGVAEAQRENLNAVGGLQTYRDELLFVTNAYREQISTLQQVGATEQQIASLRVDLAKQQLSIFEQQIANVRQNASALLTQQGAGQQFFQAGQAAAAAANIAENIGIRPGAAPTTAQQDELARAILSLPLEIRQDLNKAFSSAPPGQTAGAFGLGELETLILSSLGGRSEATPDLLALEKQASQQRLIIAENSTSQLESSRTGVITSLEQLATAKEGLIEAKANKDLAQMQLDSLDTELPQQTTLLNDISGNLSRGSAENISSRQTETQRVVDEMIRLGQTIEVGLNNSPRSVDLSGGTNAAGGTLSGAEVGGLLRAASREKSAMPAGAGLGVFNTSETVLTRGQANRLRGGRSIPNAANGTAVVASPEVVSLLQDISNRVGELRQRPVTQQINVDIDSNRRVNIEGVAGLQTALQDIIGDRTGDLYTREEAAALEEVLSTIINKLRETGQISAIGT